MENKILKSYTDIKNPGSFSGLSGFLKNNKKQKFNHVKKHYLLHPHIPCTHPQNTTFLGLNGCQVE